MPNTCWYTRRHELEEGMVFATNEGVVKLLNRVAGDGTKWCVADWSNGWSYYGSTVEPGDLMGEPIADNPTDIAKAM